MTVTAITDAEFETEVLGADGPVLVEFWAPWCGPCHQLAPVVERIAEERDGSLRVVKMNQDEQPLASARFKVMGLPTLLLFRDGEAVAGYVGARPKAAIDKDLDKALGCDRESADPLRALTRYGTSR